MDEENKQLKNIQFQNDNKLNQLTGYVEPLEQEITFQSGTEPHTIQKYTSSHQKNNTFVKPKDGKREYKNTSWHKTMSKSNKGQCEGSSTVKGGVNIKPKNMIKTVFLPNEQINNFGIEVDILKSQAQTEQRF